ncbi:MAG: carboxypeptidase-like regulatory domain-containing protein [Saprospiraceae bacterium]
MKKILFTICFLSATLVCFSQNRLLKGKVTSASNEPLIGASMVIKGTAIATVTDLEGHFQLMIKDTLILLETNYTGFEPKLTMVRKEDNNIHIRLNELAKLEEVVVTGYGIEPRADLAIKGRVASAALSARSPAFAPSPTMAPAMSTTLGYVAYSDDAPVPGGTLLAAGQLTAGEIHDFSKWELWQDIAETDLQMYQEIWKIKPAQRYALQLLGQDERPLVNAKVRLMDRQRMVWETSTDNTGKAELWANLFGAEQLGNNLSIQVSINGENYDFKQATTFHAGINMLKVPTACNLTESVDIAFVVDATGSMGDEIQYLQAELADVIHKVRDTLPGVLLRTGAVFYRDKGEEYLTRTSALQTSTDQTLKFMQNQAAAGGGDYPEAVEVAMEKALDSLNWDPKARARLLFLVLDAPPHEDEATIKKMAALTQKAAAMGIRIVPVVASGINKSAEYLFRAIALATNGTYVFLTDDSGIGGSHIKPTTDEFEVEKLNELLVRVVYQLSYAPDCETELTEAAIADLWPDLGDQSTEVLAQNWTYYPNPTSGPLFIKWEEQQPEAFFLSDFNGKILKRFVPTDQQLEIDLSAFPAGAYLIGFNVGEKWHSERVFRIQQ